MLLVFERTRVTYLANTISGRCRIIPQGMSFAMYNRDTSRLLYKYIKDIAFSEITTYYVERHCRLLARTVTYAMKISYEKKIIKFPLKNFNTHLYLGNFN